MSHPSLLRSLCIALALGLSLPAHAETGDSIMVPLNRSTMVTSAVPVSDLMVADPDIADAHTHSATSMTVDGKRLGHTSLRIFDKEGKLLREISVTVGYDLPAIRHALKEALPNEVIAAEMVNTGIALTGQISSSEVAEQAIRIVREFMQGSHNGPAAQQTVGLKERPTAEILNFMQVAAAPQAAPAVDTARPADALGLFFFGRLESLSGSAPAPNEAVEGPVGFMVD